VLCRTFAATAPIRLLPHNARFVHLLNCVLALAAGAMVYGNGFFGVTEANYSVVLVHLLTCAIRQCSQPALDSRPHCLCGISCIVLRRAVGQRPRLWLDLWAGVLFCGCDWVCEPCRCTQVPVLLHFSQLPVCRPETWTWRPLASLAASSLAQQALPSVVISFLTHLRVRGVGGGGWVTVDCLLSGGLPVRPPLCRPVSTGLQINDNRPTTVNQPSLLTIHQPTLPACS
jgi:hypothetical protein